MREFVVLELATMAEYLQLFGVIVSKLLRDIRTFLTHVRIA